MWDMLHPRDFGTLWPVAECSGKDDPHVLYSQEEDHITTEAVFIGRKIFSFEFTGNCITRYGLQKRYLSQDALRVRLRKSYDKLECIVCSFKEGVEENC